MTLSGVTIPGQSEPVSDDNKGILRIPQNSTITGTSQSDCLESYPSAKKQSVYSTTLAEWAMRENIVAIKGVFKRSI